jgi:hypothetical protein
MSKIQYIHSNKELIMHTVLPNKYSALFILSTATILLTSSLSVLAKPVTNTSTGGCWIVSGPESGIGGTFSGGSCCTGGGKCVQCTNADGSDNGVCTNMKKVVRPKKYIDGIKDIKVKN